MDEKKNQFETMKNSYNKAVADVLKDISVKLKKERGWSQERLAIELTIVNANENSP